MKHKAAKITELKNGQMKKLEVASQAVLLIKHNDKFYAVYPHCSHIGAPLDEGSVCGCNLRCPWHHSRFDIKNGEMVDPPGPHSLASFDVTIDGEDVIIEIPENVPQVVPLKTAKPDPDKDHRNFIIAGSGAAGVMAAHSLRRFGFKGKIKMLTKDKHLPYDRTVLSKSYLKDPEKTEPAFIYPKEFYQEHQIDIEKDKSIENIDIEKKELRAGKKSYRYDKLLLATGSAPRVFPIENNDLNNIFTLRTFDDFLNITNALKTAKRLLVIGASFISMEVASSAAARGIETVVTAPEAIPFELTLGTMVGKIIMKIHQQNGTELLMGRKVQKFAGQHSVESALLDDGTEIKADAVVMGTGVIPCTAYLADDLKNHDQSLTVDKYLHFRDDIYAAGDIATYPDPFTGKDVRIEHWRLAQQHGMLAAANMLDMKKEIYDAPMFWSSQFDMKLRYIGHCPKPDSVIVDGPDSDNRFFAYYLEDSMVKACAASGFDRKIAEVAEMMIKKQDIELEKIRNVKQVSC